MDIKDLNKTQLILLSLLITFVVSIATGIVTVSLMQQMPKSVPQTINNVIQRTIEKVSAPTPTAPATTDTTTGSKDTSVIGGDGNALVSIYSVPQVQTQVDSTTTPAAGAAVAETPKMLGQGVIISDIGLVLVDANILPDEKAVYSVTLNDTGFDATVLEKFGNGFAILKISPKGTAKPETTTPVTGASTTSDTAKPANSTPVTPKP